MESLRNVDPRLSDSEITQQRLSLEQAIRDVEADAVRRLSVKAPQPRPVAKSGLAQEGWDEKPAPDGARLAAGQGPALGMPLPEPESQLVTSPDAGPEVKDDDTSARQRRARAAADAQDLDRLRLLLDKAAHHAEGAGAQTRSPKRREVAGPCPRWQPRTGSRAGTLQYGTPPRCRDQGCGSGSFRTAPRTARSQGAEARARPYDERAASAEEIAFVWARTAPSAAG